MGQIKTLSQTDSFHKFMTRDNQTNARPNNPLLASAKVQSFGSELNNTVLCIMNDSDANTLWVG